MSGELGKIKVPRFKKENGFVVQRQRSELMSKIKGKGTKPEIALRKALWALGIRYRVNYKKLKGNPDIVILKSKVAIFVDGEFWHGYKWEDKKKKIKANRGFWIPKIERNMQRDAETNRELKAIGYTVVRLWEHEIKKDMPSVVERIKIELRITE
jgi:DNA mismatch endonuclease, patch repair protein